MPKRKRAGALTKEEKRIVKALLKTGWRNQDIQALVNINRSTTVNSARITEVKQNERQAVATDSEVEFYKMKKRSVDPQTGLNLVDHERLIRAREAMILAVQIFNSAALKFKTEIFAVLANIAWTYLLHEYYERKNNVNIERGGKTLLLSQMIERDDCPLSEGIKNNLKALKEIRDDVEHKLLGRSDIKWLGLFQACCLNFDKTICDLFSDDLTLAQELSFALQFSKMDFDQAVLVQQYEIPEHIETLDARLAENMTEEQLADLEYQFRVVYTLDAASKGRAHIEFLRPDSTEGKEFRNVLVQQKIADQLYPHKPSAVANLVKKRSGQRFTLHNHTQAWRFFRVRPQTGSAQPENTNRDFCIYHQAHDDYTYSDEWVDFLVDKISDEETFAAIRNVSLRGD